MKYIVQHHFQRVGLGGNRWFVEAVDEDNNLAQAHLAKKNLEKLLKDDGKPMFEGILLVEAFRE